MELSSTMDYQNAKNKRRLVQQNTRLKQQVDLIAAQVAALDAAPIPEELPADPHQPRLPDNPHQPLLQEISMQERLMRQLRSRIEGFRLERAKDNVEYIVHEEDELKIAKQVCARLTDERDVLARRRDDKHARLQTNLPYQNYEKNFLEGLTAVVHHNRDQAAQLTEIEREIRKYHLIVKNARANAAHTPTPLTPNHLHALDNQIAEKSEQRKALERQWKPHLDQLDEEYAKLLRELAAKREVVGELEREERGWDTRMRTVRAAEDVLDDRRRLSQVVVNPKLKQQMEEYLLNEEEKKKKKVNNEELKYQFKSNKEEEEKEEKQKKPEPPSAKKKEEKVIETMHDDKNISKKVEKLPNNAKKPTKVDQMHNTDVSLPVSSASLPGGSASLPGGSASLTGGSDSMSASKQKGSTEERNVRHWEADVEQTKREKSVREAASKNGVLRLKEVSISTDARHWSPKQE